MYFLDNLAGQKHHYYENKENNNSMNRYIKPDKLFEQYYWKVATKKYEPKKYTNLKIDRTDDFVFLKTTKILTISQAKENIAPDFFMIVNIKISPTVTKSILVGIKDDIYTLTANFCQKYNLNPQLIYPISSQIRKSIETMKALMNHELTPGERDELIEIEGRLEATNLSSISDFSYVDDNKEVADVNNFSF